MRWLFRLLGMLVTLVVLAVVVLFLIPSDRIAALAAREFQAATGRALQLSGAVRPSVWPQLGVTTGPVQVANAAWSDQGPMLSADALTIGLDLGELIGGRIVIRKVEAVRPVIVLERHADGRGNWQFGPDATGGTEAAEGSDPASAPTRGFTLDRGLISDGQLTFIDHAGGTRTRLQAIGADVSLPSYDGPADLTATAEMNGQRLALTAQVAVFSAFLAGQVVPVSLSLEASGLDGTGLEGSDLAADFTGRAGLAPLALDGQVQVGAGSLQSVFALIGLPPPDLPQAVAGAVGLTGQVTYVPEGSAHLRAGQITLAGNVLAGAADLYLGGDTPRFVAQMSGRALDFSALTGADGGAAGDAGAAQPAPGWSEATLDVSALSALDGEITLAADSIKLGPARLSATQLVLRLDRARAVVELRDVQAYQGTLTGEFVVNGRDGLSVGGNLSGANLSLAPLLSDLAGQDRLSGTGQVAFKFLGVGNSLAAIMRSLSGQGAVRLAQGEVRGIDLAGMLQTLDLSRFGSGSSTVFDDITASFTIAGGVARNDDLRLTAPLLTASGAGTVAIGAQTLDYRLTATALAGAAGAGIAVPLHVTGPWADPDFELDLDEALNANFAEEKARLEAEARAKLAEEAARLGVVARDGESLEDAARRTVEEKAAAELGKLLGLAPAPVDPVVIDPAVVAPVDPAAGVAPAPVDPATAAPSAPPPAVSPEQQLLDLLLKQGQGG